MVPEATYDEKMAAVAEAQLLMMTSSIPNFVYLPAVLR